MPRFFQRRQQARTLLLVGGMLARRGFKRAAHEVEFAHTRGRDRDLLPRTERRSAVLQVGEAACDTVREQRCQADAGEQRRGQAPAIQADAAPGSGADRRLRHADCNRPAVVRDAREHADQLVALQIDGVAHALGRSAVHQARQCGAGRTGDPLVVVLGACHDGPVGIDDGDHGVRLHALAFEDVQDAVGLDDGAQRIQASGFVADRHAYRKRHLPALPARYVADQRLLHGQQLAQAFRIGGLPGLFAVRRGGAEQDLAGGVGQGDRQPFGLGRHLVARDVVEGAQVTRGHGRRTRQAGQRCDRAVQLGIDGARQGARLVEQDAGLFALLVLAGRVQRPQAQQCQGQQADRAEQDEQPAQGKSKTGGRRHGVCFVAKKHYMLK